MKYFQNIKLFLFILTIFLVSIIFPQSTFADGEISSSQDVTYTVNEDGTTTAKHLITLTNLTSNYYASQYSLFLGFKDLNSIVAYDSQGSIKPTLTDRDDGKDVLLTFNDKVVGVGKSLQFTFSYTTNQIAKRNGKVWEITIPKVKDSAELGNYRAHLIVPASFGKPNYIKPLESNGVKVDASTNDLIFNKEDILKGISVGYGDYQQFNYSLVYHLHNPRLYAITTEIALPPTTAYQDVILQNITPKPLSVYRDQDGNWLARYRVEASKKIDITATGRAKVYASAQERQPMGETEKKQYLAPKIYWETQDPTILNKAKELKTPQAIYNYVVSTLSYDYDKINKDNSRLGAREALVESKQAICMEFTDLFIALSRAAGIPAREVDGYALTENSKFRPLSLTNDILHAWPEYYDSEKETWIAIDPTWGNTTNGLDYFNSFDFNHFGFVVKGLDSEYPNPAGSYKTDDKSETKDVTVSVSDGTVFGETIKPVVMSSIPKIIPAGLPNTYSILIENDGNSLYKGGTFSLSSEKLNIKNKNIQIDPIPPFGTAKVDITLSSLGFLDNTPTTIKASLDNQKFEYSIMILPAFLVYLPLIGGIICAAAVLFLAREAWRLYFQRRKR